MATGRLYAPTELGKAAGQDPRVPVEYRAILRLIQTETHPDSLRDRLARLSQAGLVSMLDKLVERGLLKAVEAGAHHDLDFTTNLKAA